MTGAGDSRSDYGRRLPPARSSLSPGFICNQIETLSLERLSAEIYEYLAGALGYSLIVLL